MKNLVLIELDDIELAQLSALADASNASREETAKRLISKSIVDLVNAELDGLLSGGEHY